MRPFNSIGTLFFPTVLPLGVFSVHQHRVLGYSAMSSTISRLLGALAARMLIKLPQRPYSYSNTPISSCLLFSVVKFAIIRKSHPTKGGSPRKAGTGRISPTQHRKC